MIMLMTLNIKKFFVLPFIHNVTKSATRLISKAVYNIGYRCIINRFIKVYKDKKEFVDNNNVVSKILCNDCDAFYVDQIKKKFNINKWTY